MARLKIEPRHYSESWHRVWPCNNELPLKWCKRTQNLLLPYTSIHQTCPTGWLAHLHTPGTKCCQVFLGPPPWSCTRSHRWGTTWTSPVVWYMDSILTTYSSAYPTSLSGSPVVGSQSFTWNFSVFKKVPLTGIHTIYNWTNYWYRTYLHQGQWSQLMYNKCLVGCMAGWEPGCKRWLDSLLVLPFPP